MAEHNQLGKKGEESVIRFLKANGYQILETNWRYKHAEIDIIAKQNRTLVFVEVKTRSTEVFGFPEESVNKQKIKKLCEASDAFIYEINYEGEIRFDIVSVIKNKSGFEKIHHIRDAFFPMGDFFE